jgi:NitT/TauT family transport system permease protein
VIEFGRATTSDPAIVYTAVLGAAALGLMMAALIAMIDAALMRNRPREVAS